MAIEDILATLEEQAQADIDAVLHEAAEHAQMIESEAKLEAERIHAGFTRQVEKTASGEAAKVVNAARLEAKMLVSRARGESVEAVFTQAASGLGSLRADPGYEALFTRLLTEALEGLEPERLAIKVDPRDEVLAGRAIAAMGVDANLVADLVTDGGVVVEANGGRIIRRNTVEDRLDRARRYVVADVAKALFA